MDFFLGVQLHFTINPVFMAKKGFEWAGELHQAERNP